MSKYQLSALFYHIHKESSHYFELPNELDAYTIYVRLFKEHVKCEEVTTTQNKQITCITIGTTWFLSRRLTDVHDAIVGAEQR